ncbi:MAG: hypothetical protein FJ267_08385 [Planctomycetes bacterium]|nr:hypothetical protein [Planctomycetota bacterium]
MSRFSTVGKWYLAFCVLTSGWFSTAALSGWKTPVQMEFPSGGFESGPHTGYSSGRSLGGSWGGGK